MGRKVIRQPPRADPRAYVGKKRDRSNVWKPSRNPLLEQMKPMPPASCFRGARRVAREATFDPLRGAFVVLARPNDPEPNPPERRRGLRGSPSKEPGQVKALLSEGSPTLKLPKIHKRQAPEGAQVNNDLGAVMQMKELTDHDKAVLYSNYQKAMELSLARDGVLDGLTWRHRVTHEPAPPLPHRWANKSTSRAPPPYGTLDGGSPPATTRSGRRPCKAFTEDQGERFLSWNGTAQRNTIDPPRPRKLPPSYEAEAHLDAFFDDTRSMKLTAPMQKQRRHIPGHAGEIDETISPIGDRERRELHALEMHEFTAPKKPTPPPPTSFGGTRYRRPTQAVF